ncbi:dynamin family protein [Psychrobacter okhotskensis]|uniref:dynamin family protein n=1 Tax=Psychrobacter okhotskensis TaxID=212403 RepID=UPI00191A8114|nr:dynamin family protein [Psychrobacter okhotskensis]
MSIANNGMTKLVLNGYKEDAIKILQTQISMLSDIESEILSKESESKTDDSKSEGILTQETCKEFKQVLKGEVHKLQNFDVVLAVVGTMKAGKSTTINAIVGREILPNRNRPMTSLPTLICHNKEQTTPKLNFNSQPINKFLVEVKSALGVCSIENPSPEIVELIQFVQQNRLFSDTYNGETDIFDFLQRLNDLVRLAATINNIADNELLKFPYDSYQNIDALPMIEVAFRLQDDFETNGRFMLLDTAGPNESGHKELLGLLREQLKRSSAVMLVLDYTQLNSEAEESIKNEIEAIPTIQKSRLFALVNKFDQESANADDAETTKKHIFNNLLKDKIDLEHIYPISARDAYLANRMESYLLENKNKPDYKEGTWIEDFAKQLLGKRAEQKYEKMDAEDISEELGALIDDSRMSEPLTDVILNMQRNAPYIAIQSALAGASDVFEKLHNFFNIRGHFAEKEKMTDEEIAELENTIKKLEKQINESELLSEDIKKTFSDIKQKAKKEMKKKEETRNIMSIIDKELIDMFDMEADKNQKEANDIDKTINKTPLQWISKLESSKERKIKLEALDKAKELARSSKHALVFSTKSDLDTFQVSVESMTSDLIQEVINEYSSILDESIEDTQKITTNLYEKCNNLLNNLQDEFNREGLKELKIESIDSRIKQNQNGVLKNLNLNVSYKKISETRNESGITSGIRRKLGGWFGKSWGTYEVDIETYTINKRDMNNKIKFTIKEKIIAPLGKEIENTLSELLDKNITSIDKFNETIKDVVEEMNNAIIQEKMPDLEEKKQYKEKIVKLQNSSQHTEENWEKLSDKFAVEKVDTQLKSDIAA